MDLHLRIVNKKATEILKNYEKYGYSSKTDLITKGILLASSTDAVKAPVDDISKKEITEMVQSLVKNELEEFFKGFPKKKSELREQKNTQKKKLKPAPAPAPDPEDFSEAEEEFEAEEEDTDENESAYTNFMQQFF